MPVPELRECPSCGNHSAVVVRDRKDRAKAWHCDTIACLARGIFLDGERYLAVTQKPHRDEEKE